MNKTHTCATPCQSVKTNRLLLGVFATFIVSWLGWLSVSMINSRTDTKVFMAEIKVRLVQIQKDIIELKNENREERRHE